MKDAAYIKMGYPVVSKSNPFLSITIRNVDLRRVVPTGTGLTYAKVYRSGEAHTGTGVAPVEISGNTLKFIMTPIFLAGLGGRYTYEIVYKGVYIGKSQFQYNKVEPTFEESVRV